jgi:hypothetical protein
LRRAYQAASAATTSIPRSGNPGCHPEEQRDEATASQNDNFHFCHPEERSDEGSALSVQPKQILRFAQDDNSFAQKDNFLENETSIASHSLVTQWLHRHWREMVLLAPAFATAVVLALHGPIPQDPRYDLFADTRSMLGIPNAANVLSNLAFLLAGAAGLLFLSTDRSATAFRESHERLPYFFFFAGVCLTAFGSAWYHLAPDHARLVWDRLPMTVAFLSLFAAFLAERVRPDLARRLLAPFLLAGIASVLYWRFTEQDGRGDLRPYALVQYYPVVALGLLLLLYPARFTLGSVMWGVGGFYALAKAFELADEKILRSTGFVSGHTLKHLAAAAAAALVLFMLARRRPIGEDPSSEVA